MTTLINNNPTSCKMWLKVFRLTNKYYKYHDKEQEDDKWWLLEPCIQKISMLQRRHEHLDEHMYIYSKCQCSIINLVLPACQLQTQDRFIPILVRSIVSTDNETIMKGLKAQSNDNESTLLIKNLALEIIVIVAYL